MNAVSEGNHVEAKCASGSAGVMQYNRIVLLTDGNSTPWLAKTAISLLRYRTEDVVAIWDRDHAGSTAGELFGVGGQIPVVASIDDLSADALFLGIAPPGGKVPAAWRELLRHALMAGVDVVSGLHDFLVHDQQFSALAHEHGARLVDVRQNSFKTTASGQPLPDSCLRVHTVGHDCSVGKMVVALEVQRELRRRGRDAAFLATGQTGIMISGSGVPIDCVVSDFVNGAAETLVRQHLNHEIQLIEGQGSIAHPSFSGVTMGLLHGCAPHGLIFCCELGRTHVKGLDNVPLQSIQRQVQAFEVAARLRRPCRVIGVGVNARNVDDATADRLKLQLVEQLGLPVCDVYRDGPSVLVDAVVELEREYRS